MHICAGTPKSMPEYQQFLRQITAIQTETIRRLVDNGATPPLEFAAVLEDIANQFLDISEEIRDLALSCQETGIPSAPTHRAEDIQA